jgi:ATP-dependent 26S proteasome regulatory subunit
VLEDLDVLGGLDRHHQVGGSLGQLLGELDGLESNQGVVTVATTNDASVLDDALKSRPGRFDVKLHFPNPGHDLRMQLLKLFTKSLTLAPDVDLTTLSNRMEYGNLSAAHVREVVTRSVIFAADELSEGADADPVVNQAHLERALTLLADPKRKIGFEPSRG